MTKEELRQTIREAAPKLEPLSPVLREDALLRIGYIYAGKARCWCSGCGQEFENAELWKNRGVKTAVCPCCGRKHDVRRSAQKMVENMEYLYTKLETVGDVQVIRNFQVNKSAERHYERADLGVLREGGISSSAIIEVSQNWIANGGRLTEVWARRSYWKQGAYDYGWALASPMDFRKPTRKNTSYYDSGYVAPGAKLLPELRKHGLRKPDEGVNQHSFLCDLLREPMIETLLKTGQKNLLHYWYHSWQGENQIRHFWRSLTIANRHGHKVKDASLYMDYLEDLEELGLDLRSPKYLCPDDLRKAHAQTQRRRRRKEEEEERRRQAEMAMKDKEAIERYNKRMEAFAGLVLVAGDIRIEALMTVDAVRAEGRSMHHCVFENKYYKKVDSLLMSARRNGKRVETIEFSLSSGQVIQSRAVNNGFTEWHKEIVATVNENAHLLQRTAGRVA